MDYESMSIRQLQAECKERGLPSGRAKSELIDRLTADDATNAEALATPETPAETAPAHRADPPPDVVSGSAGRRTFRQTFPAGPEGPGEEEHLAYRQSTLQAAVDAGLTPRGDAHRVGTVDGHEVYEVPVRAVS